MKSDLFKCNSNSIQMLWHLFEPDHLQAQYWHSLTKCFHRNTKSRIKIKAFVMFSNDLRLFHHIHVRFPWIFLLRICPPLLKYNACLHKSFEHHHDSSSINIWKLTEMLIGFGQHRICWYSGTKTSGHHHPHYQLPRILSAGYLLWNHFSL